jgi:AcrR family transcriptional regulator
MGMSHAQPLARTSERGAATRSGLLAAARRVFLAQGYAQAGITDIVTLAGASVGSLYHHFSGKADLYRTLYEELANEHSARTRAAVRCAKGAGVRDPMQLFLAGARGYLDVAAEQRELAGLFMRGEPLDAAVAIVLTGAMSLAVAEMSLAPDAQAAQAIADGVIEVLSRLELSRPHS